MPNRETRSALRPAGGELINNATCPVAWSWSGFPAQETFRIALVKTQTGSEQRVIAVARSRRRTRA